MGVKDVWNKVTGKLPAEKPPEKPIPPAQKPVPNPQGPSAADLQKQAAKDRVATPGPAERFITKQPEVRAKALEAKAERENPKPTKHDHVPPSVPKPAPMIQTPMGLRQAPAPTSQPRPMQPAAPTVPRTPTNADRMLDRVKNTPPPKPPIKSFRENHPDINRSRGR